MSVKMMGLVWDMQIPRPEKYVLLAYADHANHEGENIFPSHDTIAHKTGYTRRQVVSITNKLSKPKNSTKKHPARPALLLEDGISKYGTNKWRMNITACKNLACEKIAHVAGDDVKNPQVGGEKNSTDGAEISHEPSLKPLIKPLEEYTKEEKHWLDFKDQLSTEMPRSEYLKYIEPTFLYEYQGGKYTIGINDTFKRDFLEQRLTKQAERFMAGMNGDSPAVEFIVAPKETA